MPQNPRDPLSYLDDELGRAPAQPATRTPKTTSTPATPKSPLDYLDAEIGGTPPRRQSDSRDLIAVGHGSTSSPRQPSAGAQPSRSPDIQQKQPTKSRQLQPTASRTAPPRPTDPFGRPTLGSQIEQDLADPNAGRVSPRAAKIESRRKELEQMSTPRRLLENVKTGYDQFAQGTADAVSRLGDVAGGVATGDFRPLGEQLEGAGRGLLQLERTHPLVGGLIPDQAPGLAALQQRADARRRVAGDLPYIGGQVENERLAQEAASDPSLSGGVTRGLTQGALSLPLYLGAGALGAGPGTLGTIAAAQSDFTRPQEAATNIAGVVVPIKAARALTPQIERTATMLPARLQAPARAAGQLGVGSGTNVAQTAAMGETDPQKLAEAAIVGGTLSSVDAARASRARRFGPADIPKAQQVAAVQNEPATPPRMNRMNRASIARPQTEVTKVPSLESVTAGLEAKAANPQEAQAVRSLVMGNEPLEPAPPQRPSFGRLGQPNIPEAASQFQPPRAGQPGVRQPVAPVSRLGAPNIPEAMSQAPIALPDVAPQPVRQSRFGRPNIQSATEVVSAPETVPAPRRRPTIGGPQIFPQAPEAAPVPRRTPVARPVETETTPDLGQVVAPEPVNAGDQQASRPVAEAPQSRRQPIQPEAPPLEEGPEKSPELTALEAKYKEDVARVKSGPLNRQEKGSRLRAMGERFAAEKRRLTGTQTEKERARDARQAARRQPQEPLKPAVVEPEQSPAPVQTSNVAQPKPEAPQPPPASIPQSSIDWINRATPEQLDSAITRFEAALPRMEEAIRVRRTAELKLMNERRRQLVKDRQIAPKLPDRPVEEGPRLSKGDMQTMEPMTPEQREQFMAQREATGKAATAANRAARDRRVAANKAAREATGIPTPEPVKPPQNVEPTKEPYATHQDFGPVTLSDNQAGAGRGKVRVVDAQGNEHIINKRSRNQRAIKAKEATPVSTEPLSVKPEVEAGAATARRVPKGSEKTNALRVPDDLRAQAVADSVYNDEKVQVKNLGLESKFPGSLPGRTRTAKKSVNIDDITLGRDDLSKGRMLQVEDALKSGIKQGGTITTTEKGAKRRIDPIKVQSDPQNPGKYIVAGDGNHRIALLKLAGYKGNVPVEATELLPRKSGQAKSLAQFVKESGGIKPSIANRGELAYASTKESGKVAVVNRRGIPADEMRRQAVEAGYGKWETESEFLNSLRDDVQGRKVTSIDQSIDHEAEYKKSLSPDEQQETAAFDNFLGDKDAAAAYDRVTGGDISGKAVSELARHTEKHGLSEDILDVIVGEGRAARDRQGQTKPLLRANAETQGQPQRKEQLKRSRFSVGPVEETKGGTTLGSGFGSLQGGTGRRQAPVAAANIPGRLNVAALNRAAEGQAAKKTARKARPAKKTEPASIPEKLSTFRKAGFLGGLPTHLRNIGGNTAFGATEEAARAPGAVTDMLVSSITGRRTLTGPSAKAVARAGYEAATKGVADAKRVLKTGQTAEEAAQSQRTESHYKNPILKTYTQAIFRSLGAEDAVFKSYALRRALEGRAKAQAITEARQRQIPRSQIKSRAEELIKNPTDEISQGAIEDSLVAVFQNENAASAFMRGGREKVGPGANLAIDIFLPYDRTPTNIIIKTLDYSPAGFARATGQTVKAVARGVRSVRAQRKAGEVGLKRIVKQAIDDAISPEQQKAFAETVGRATTGSTVFLTLGAFLESKGMLTGYYGDKDEEKRNEAAGKQPGSLIVGGRSYRIDGFGPPGALLVLGATLAREYDRPLKDEDDRPWRMAKAAGEMVSQIPFLESAKEANALIKMEGNVAAKAGRLVGGFIPTVGNIGRMTDTSEREGGTFWGEIQKQIPGLRNLLPVKQTATGEPMEREFRGILDPTQSRPVKETPLLNEMEDLGMGIGLVKKKDDESDEDFKARSGFANRMFKDAGETLAQNERFKELTPAQKEAAIKSLKVRAAKESGEDVPDMDRLDPDTVIDAILATEQKRADKKLEKEMERQ